MAGWSIIPVFQTFLCTSLMNTGCPGLSSIGEWVQVLGCHLISLFLILNVSTVFPMLEGIRGSEVLSFLPVRASSGDGRLPARGVTLCWSSFVYLAFQFLPADVSQWIA